MITLSYFDAFGFGFMIFSLGVIYEYFASRYDYNTGEYLGKCIKREKSKKIKKDETEG